MTGKKTPSNSRDRDSKSSKSLANFKIGKLNPAMSDDAKRAKVKALMESFNKSAQNTQSQKPKSSFKSAKVPPKSTSNMKSHESSSKKLKRKHESSKKPNVRPYTPAKKPRAVPPASSIDQTISSYLKKQETMTSSSMKKNKPTPQKPSEVQVQKAKTEHVSVKKPSSSINVNSGVKKPVNPYKHTVVKAKGVDPAKRLIDPWAKEKGQYDTLNFGNVDPLAVITIWVIITIGLHGNLTENFCENSLMPQPGAETSIALYCGPIAYVYVC